MPVLWLPNCPIVSPSFLLASYFSSAYVLQTIPLRSNLRVEMYLIIESLEAECLVEVDDFVIELLAPEASKLDIV